MQPSGNARAVATGAAAKASGWRKAWAEMPTDDDDGGDGDYEGGDAYEDRYAHGGEWCL